MKKKSKTERNITVDRISELPESIIHDHIMPRLSRRNRARISVASKTWYHLNKTYPALDFDFRSKLCKSFNSFKKRADKSLHRFSQRNLCLHSLRVKPSVYNYPESYKSDFDRWVESAIENRVEKLKLYCPYSHDYKSGYFLPQPVYFSATLTTLKLVQCVLDQPLSLFTSVKKLTLSQCYLNIGPIMLNHSDCPTLESLTLDKCVAFDSLYISNLARLSRIVLDLHSPLNVEIASQRVQEIRITDSILPKHLLKINIDICNCLKSLYFKHYAITDQDLDNFLSKFAFLEELYVFGYHKLKAVKVSSQRLKTLVIAANCGPDLTSIDIDAPTLKKFMFLSNMTEQIKVQASGLETLVLHSKVMTDVEFHELIANFPLLQSVWLVGCYKFQTIEIINPQLERLYITRCVMLDILKVGSRKLFKMYCDFKGLKVLVTHPDVIYSARRLRHEEFVDCKSCFWSVSFQRMLISLVRENFIVKDICSNCFLW